MRGNNTAMLTTDCGFIHRPHCCVDSAPLFDHSEGTGLGADRKDLGPLRQVLHAAHADRGDVRARSKRPYTQKKRSGDMSLDRIPLQQLLALRASPNGDVRAPPAAVMTDGAVARVRYPEADLASYACAAETVGQQKHQREH